MAYTKFVAAVTRANNINKMRILAGRCRSTVASTKTRRERDQLDGCAVVETEPVELISQTEHLKKTKLTKIQIDFDNAQEAYKSKGNIELLRSLLVFKLCAIDLLVEKNREVSTKVWLYWFTGKKCDIKSNYWDGISTPPCFAFS